MPALIETTNRQKRSLQEALLQKDAEVKSVRAQLDIAKKGESDLKLALTTARRDFGLAINKRDEEMKNIVKTTVADFRQLMSQTVAKDDKKTGKLMEELARKDKQIADLLHRMETKLEQLEKKNGKYYGIDEEFDFRTVRSELQQMVEEQRQAIDAKNQVPVADSGVNYGANVPAINNVTLLIQ